MPTPASDAAMSDAESIAKLEARVAALGATVRSVLTTLMLRGLLTKAEIAPLLAEAEASLSASIGADGAKAGHAMAAAKTELGAIHADLPACLREAMGPAPDDDDHDH